MNISIGLTRAPTLAQSFLSPQPQLAVLVVDDEVEVLEELAGALGRRGMTVLSAGSADAALAVLRGRPDIGTLVSDIRMPGMDGLALAEAALAGRSEANALEVVLITGYVAASHGIAASRLGAFGLMRKPMRGADLSLMVQEALNRAGQRRAGEAPDLPRLPIRPSMAPPQFPHAAPPQFPHAAPPQFPHAAPPQFPHAAPPQFSHAAPPQFSHAEFSHTAARRHALAAEALLHSLTLRLDEAGNGIEAVARDLQGPLGDLLRGAPRQHTASRGLMALLDDLLDLAALESGTARPQRAPISAHGLVSAVANRLATRGIACGRRITLQPDADPAFPLDTARLVRAVALLAGLVQGGQPGGMADLAIDAGAGQARLDLVLRPGAPAEPPLAEAERRLPLAIARRLVALQGGRLDAWHLPEGGLRARLLIRGV